MNDLNENVTVSSLRRYADYLIRGGYQPNCASIQSLNKGMESISSWLDRNYLHANGDYIQGMIGLGNSSYFYNLKFEGISISLKEHLKILGVYFDDQLSFKEHKYIAKESIC